MGWEAMHNAIRTRFKDQIQKTVFLSSPSLSAKTTVSFSSTDDSINDSTEDLSVFDGYNQVYVSGASNSANNDVHQIKAVTSNKITTSTSLTTEGAGQSVTIQVPIPVLYDNDGVDIPQNNTEFIRFTIIPGDTGDVSFGETMTERTVGTAIAQIFIPVGRGDQEAISIADSIRSAFRTTRTGGVDYFNPYADSIGITGEGHFFQYNVNVDFEYDETY